MDNKQQFQVVDATNKVLFSNKEKSKCITFCIQKMKYIPSQQRDVYHDYLRPQKWAKIV